MPNIMTMIVMSIKKVSKNDLDYSTYDNSLASEEIDYCKNKNQGII